MEKRVKHFTSNWPEDLAYQMNKFLMETKGKVHDTKYLRDIDAVDAKYCAFVTYTPEEEENEEKIKRPEEGKKSNGGIQGRRVAFPFIQRSYCKV